MNVPNLLLHTHHRPFRFAAILITLALLVGCTPGGVSAPATDSEAATESHDGGHGDHMAMSEDLPFDAAFIDSMVVHHEGAVQMATELVENTERPELLAMADAIIATQSSEIAQMQAWREEWFGDLAASEGMDMDMGAMEVSDDESIPYDRRFLDAMIDHHKGAIAMAERALQDSERAEIRTLAEAIIAAQEAEVAQMEGWLREWFPE